MKTLITCTLIFLCAVSVLSHAYDEDVYLDIRFDKLDEASLKTVETLFGELANGESHVCLTDGNIAALFHFVHESSIPLTKLLDVTLTRQAPVHNCKNSSSSLPSFAGLKPGMFSFEIIKPLTTNGYGKAFFDKNSAVYRKDIFLAAECHKQEATVFFPESYFYGATKEIIHYTLSDVVASEVQTLQKSLAMGFIEEKNTECDAKNFPL